MDNAGSATLSGLLSNAVEPNYEIIPADCSVSSKVSTKSTRPCQNYIEIEFKKESETPFFSYLVF